jgi:hypothetical protein
MSNTIKRMGRAGRKAARPDTGILKADLVIGFDSEFVSAEALGEANSLTASALEGLGRKGNHVICYSSAIYSPSTARRASSILHTQGPGHRHRVSFTSFVTACVRGAVEHGLLDREVVTNATTRNKLRIVMVGHFTRADLPGFKDFSRLKRRFDGIRKTYSTVQNPAVFTIKPMGRSIPCTVTLQDTALLAPAGARSLKALGQALGFNKLEVPAVTTEKGETVPGITRMDLVRAQHPEAFDAYAVRDSEIAVEWLLMVAALAEEWGLKKMPCTIGALAVGKLKSLTDRSNSIDLDRFLGLERVAACDGDKMETRPVAVIANNMAMIANSFFGGRNECYVHGVFVGMFTDYDLRGAYTTAMGSHRQKDWDRARHTTDLARVSDLETPAIAHIRFKHPESVRFPVFAVPAENGLVFPLEGETYATNWEITVARNLGCEITVLAGIVFPLVDPEGPRPFVDFTAFVNQERKKHPKKSPQELLAKESGNSLYGKTAQAIAGFKTVNPHRRSVFNTRDGSTGSLEESSISSAPIAAITTGIVRAVLTEIINDLPADAVVASATTDGFLTTASWDDVLLACTGPAASAFSDLRRLVDPAGDPAVVEVKHRASEMCIMKTRGALALVSDGPPILARAGHRLEGTFVTPEEEVRAFYDLFRTRDATTTLKRKDFIPLPDQWRGDTDLVSLDNESRVNLDFDMKRRPVDPHANEGLLRFTTAPWRTVAEFKGYVRRFNKWRAAGNTLKTLEDWQRWHATANGTPDLSTCASRAHAAWKDRSAFEKALVIAAAAPIPGKTRREVVAALAAAGIATTESALKMHTYKRTPLVPVTPGEMTEEDRRKAAVVETVLGELGFYLVSKCRI